MICCITGCEIKESDVFARAKNGVVSKQAVAQLPQDVQREPLLSIFAKNAFPIPSFPIPLWNGHWLFLTDGNFFSVESVSDSACCLAKHIQDRVDRWWTHLSPKFTYHVVKDGKYVGSASGEKPVKFFFSPEWVFADPKLANASRLLSEHDKARWSYTNQILVVTEGPDSAGISDRGPDGVVTSIKDAETAIQTVVQPGFRYYILNAGRVVSTFGPRATIRMPPQPWPKNFTPPVAAPVRMGRQRDGSQPPDAQDSERQSLVIPKVAVGSIEVLRTAASNLCIVNENGMRVGELKFMVIRENCYAVDFLPSGNEQFINCGFNEGLNTNDELVVFAAKGLTQYRLGIALKNATDHFRELIQKHDVVIGAN